MSTGARIGIIGGKGWIGGAIARAVVAAKLIPPGDLTLSCRGDPPGWLPDVHWTRDNQALADRSHVLILSVRPQDWPSIEVRAPGKLVISVMAGVTLADIAARLGTARVVRALPNAALEVGQSYTPWIAAEQVTELDRAAIRRLLDSFGSGDEVGTEAEIDYMTGLSGTGPAYPALLAVAMMRDAVANGLPKEVARRAAVAVLVGTGRLLEKTGEAPEDIVAAFVEYRGVTAAAIQAMQASGFDAAVSAGLSAALQASHALSASEPFQ
ncbi:MAG TPA: pyrroline-5-carboxylate reductase dimerization domain-containing protein [Amaricoccus sp.]|uniref:pyrroline-5-carboxylate reductase family protein n=1 Tax=Amaricoccus sp. TaxID=1872485 RepID=UPI002C4DFEBF|nr:pyrroline-5-carboxylate reductase dimerization domain-containing protein [Amaricoccus sp.]HMQ92900.1 pyrroline-5-carboxylate reductase dimerization domain-containing protein [Amaricoccus sp.]HMR52245.1 pyrroline-5-carboxylate reductase dimerization domain-containing protein [Amaricoccus sp.]HMT99097.1 pyrroline-5-carboxylate reductase dimerization domain-containing protein [Amaricoccus sp.]